MKQSSFVYTQLNDFKYSYVTLTILFNINHYFACKVLLMLSVANNNNNDNNNTPIILNGFKYCYLTQTILFNIDNNLQ